MDEQVFYASYRLNFSHMLMNYQNSYSATFLGVARLTDPCVKKYTPVRDGAGVHKEKQGDHKGIFHQN